MSFLCKQMSLSKHLSSFTEFLLYSKLERLEAKLGKWGMSWLILQLEFTLKFQLALARVSSSKTTLVNTSVF